jgi:hypothetical protein
MGHWRGYTDLTPAALIAGQHLSLLITVTRRRNFARIPPTNSL